MKKIVLGLIVSLVILIGSGCSSTNLNAIRTEATGGWVKVTPGDSQSPSPKIELGCGYASFSIIPMARGQGARFVGISNELISGHPLYMEEVTVYPVGQDSILKLETMPQSVLKIPYLIDIKADNDPNVINPTRISIIPINPSTDLKVDSSIK